MVARSKDGDGSVFVLVHSPLVGPGTWGPVAERLRQRGFEATVPPLRDVEGGGSPYWKQHADAVAQALATVPTDRPLVLTAHSGAGPLLPAVRQEAARPIAAYVFVDAAIPKDGESHLDLMASENPEFSREFRRYLESGGRFPTWGEEDLEEQIPDARLRRMVIEELRPRPLAFFEEPIPVFDRWPDAACAYLKFSPAYDVPAERARGDGWACLGMEAGHFHMLVDPSAVAEALVELGARA